ncbi:hypothetical protein Goari_006750, partial [Gossypium aridum]|nr:hypothetical protein [Gossypium aridum]
DAVSDLFDQLDKRVTLVPVILAETFRPLSACQKTENWIAILQSFQDKDVEWRAPWMIPDEILYRCGYFDWVPLLGICGVVGYAPLLLFRQYRSMQFIPITQGLAQYEFAYKCDNYKKKVRKISNAWNQTQKMKRFVANPMTTLEYDWWWGKRINGNVPSSS